MTVLVENTAKDEQLICRHRLSLLIENGERIFLFDVGLDNAPLWKSICSGYRLPFFPTYIMTTAGGLPHLVQTNPYLPIHLHWSAIDEHKNADGKDIGLDKV